MTTSSPPGERLAVRSSGWAGAPRRPRMANVEEPRAGLALTSHGLQRDGVPWVPVSGEIHYSRVPRARWLERLRQLRSGGISVVACYVPWIHHVAQRGAPDFAGDLDVAAFVDLVRAEGFELVLRIGPWAHGELRNGGFPDWVQSADVAHRTNDPGYVALVREWWTQLAGALGTRLHPDVVLGIQLENELYEAPEHLVTLKGLARELGFAAPIWTATAWGGARLPDPEVLPVYGGYGDGFWVDVDAPWDPSFRQHYFFSHQWDDPGIGADLRAAPADAVPGGLKSPWFPAATCELGGGMATAYHRRPAPAALDVAAIAHTKTGNGSAWQGYYMYAGGRNPAGGLQESHATGYPNDMPTYDYDFHAPVGAAGRLAESHAPLRRQHAFLAAFGARLGRMPSHLPDVRPYGVDDEKTLRWAFRGDGAAGFLFLAWHQPHVPLKPARQAAFRVRFDDREVALPTTPVDIPVGTLACWPVGLEIDGARVDWLTATVVTLLEGDVPTLVAVEDAGVRIELALPDGAMLDGTPVMGPTNLSAGLAAHRITMPDGGRLDLVVVPSARADEVWVPTDASGRALRVVLSRDEVTWNTAGRLRVQSTADLPDVLALEPGAAAFAPVGLAAERPARGVLDVTAVTVRAAREDRPATYGTFKGRASAPPLAVVEEVAGAHRLELPAGADDPAATLIVRWAGDVAALRVDGAIVADRFWDGTPWLLSPHDLGIAPASSVELLILPLAADAAVHLPAAAESRRRATPAPLAALDAVLLEHRGTWTESNPSDRRSTSQETS